MQVDLKGKKLKSAEHYHNMRPLVHHNYEYTIKAHRDKIKSLCSPSWKNCIKANGMHSNLFH